MDVTRMAKRSASLTCRNVLGRAVCQAMDRAGRFLEESGPDLLLGLVGRTMPGLAVPGLPDKRAFPVSYGGGKPCDDDLLNGRGLFYVTQAGKVMLDCTSGHYQMTWGYAHPRLTRALQEAIRLGVVWDNHSNIPPPPVKMLADRMVSLAGGPENGLDRILLGVATGSVACSTALKIMLACYRRDQARVSQGNPVMIVLDGNYHGTDMACQTLRGMWPGLVAGMDAAAVQPNDPAGLEAVFRRFGRRVAGFWAEPIMMNREALEVSAAYLRLARRLCDETGALMCLDEIQTGFWYPEALLTRRLGVTPDLLVAGKGMTAGFHPLSGLIFRRDLDILEQYDAISTNGSAALPAFVALCNLDLIEDQRDRIAALARRQEEGLRALAAEFPDIIERVNGSGFLLGLKFRDRGDAIAFHRHAVASGLWLRVHAYHEGHRTVLLKMALAADEQVVDFVMGRFREMLRRPPWR
jgi:acetylornithine/succinyldiaminopimelate/putrescine aminotransferase